MQYRTSRKSCSPNKSFMNRLFSECISIFHRPILVYRGKQCVCNWFMLFCFFYIYKICEKCTVSVKTWLACTTGRGWYFIHFHPKVGGIFLLISDKFRQIIFIICEENLCGQYGNYWEFRSWSDTWNLLEQDISRE